MSGQNGSGVSHVGAHNLIIVDEDANESRAAATDVDIGFGQSVLQLAENLRDAIIECSIFELVLDSFGYIFDQILRNQMPESSMPIGHSKQVDISIP